MKDWGTIGQELARDHEAFMQEFASDQAAFMQGLAGVHDAMIREMAAARQDLNRRHILMLLQAEEHDRKMLAAELAHELAMTNFRQLQSKAEASKPEADDTKQMLATVLSAISAPRRMVIDRGPDGLAIGGRSEVIAS